MAFRIQDPESGLFWSVDGTKIVLTETGDEFTETAEGLVNVFLAGSYLYFMDRPISWKFTEDGAITCGSFFIIPDVSHGCPVVAREAKPWVKVGGAPAPEPEAAAEPEPEVEAAAEPVAEPEPEVEAAAEPESEEDVPVNRAAALIEEALNAQAAAPAPEEDNE